MAVKLNQPMRDLMRVDVDTHPLFARLWRRGDITRVDQDNFQAFVKVNGLAALCLVDDPVMYKETLDMAALAPELFALFEDTLSARGFTDPAQGRAIASSLGLRRLPALAVFRFGELLGAVEGLQNWNDYERQLVEILVGQPAPKKTIVIGHA